MAFVGVVADPVAVVGWGEDKKLKLETDDGAAALFPDLFASFPPSKSANGSAGFAGAGFAGASIMDSRRSSMPEAGGAAGAAGVSPRKSNAESSAEVEAGGAVDWPRNPKPDAGASALGAAGAALVVAGSPKKSNPLSGSVVAFAAAGLLLDTVKPAIMSTGAGSEALTSNNDVVGFGFAATGIFATRLVVAASSGISS